MRRKVLPVVASLLLLAATGEPLSPSAFRDRYAAVVAAETGHPTVPVDDRTFKAKAADGTDLTISTDNAYAAYRADPDQIDAIIDRYTASLTNLSEMGKEPIDRLVVIVRPTGYLSQSLPPGDSLDNFLPSRPMAGDLSYFLAVDAPDSIRSANKEDLARWQIGEANAWPRAIANLRERVGALAPTHLGNDDGAFGFGASSGLAPSVLADPKLCGPETPSGLNDQIVLVYAKDFFLLAIPTDRAMVDRFWHVAKTEIAAGRSLSKTALTCRDGRWVVVAAP